jgi:hypothetical protein
VGEEEKIQCGEKSKKQERGTCDTAKPRGAEKTVSSTSPHPETGDAHYPRCRDFYFSA